MVADPAHPSRKILKIQASGKTFSWKELARGLYRIHLALLTVEPPRGNQRVVA